MKNKKKKMNEIYKHIKKNIYNYLLRTLLNLLLLLTSL